MFVVTLIAPPGQLDRDMVVNLRNAWGGGQPQWLARGEAAEFPVPSISENHWVVWSELQSSRIDMVLQSEADRKKKILLADMDSTMIKQECIDELAAEAGIGQQVAEITARAMGGAMDFEQALDQRVALLKGLDAAVIDKVIAERITFMPGGQTLLATMKGHGAYAALVSGGFTAFTEHVAKTLGFDEHRANHLAITDGQLSGEATRPILGQAAKVQALEEITKRLGLSETDVLAVGDGANDLGMLARAGAGVALHAKKAVQAKCDIRINHGDLTALLYLQGYARSEFIDGVDDITGA